MARIIDLPFRVILTLSISRLKLLKDEIKKPYFIALKQFLWNEGVRGADDTPKSLPIYPSRGSIKAMDGP